MRSEKVLKAMMVIQAIYFGLLLLDFLCILLFVFDVSSVAGPLALFGNFMLLLHPVEIICLIPNLIYWIKDFKNFSNRSQAVKAGVMIFGSFLLFVLFKLLLNALGNRYLIF